MGEINWKNKCWVSTVHLVKDKKVLLCLNKVLNTWIPIGGHIDPGETPEEAIIREVKEETNLNFEFLNKSELESNGKVRVLKPLRIQIEEVPHHNYHMNIVFIGKILDNLNNSEKVETDEQEKLKWFSLEDLERNKDILFENVYKNSLDAINLVN